MSSRDAPSRVEQLIAEHQPRLKAFIRRRVARKEDAEDILQDVLLQLTKTLDASLNPIEQVAAWLYRVARNAIINHGAKKREAPLPAYPTADGEEEMLSDFSEILFDAGAAASPEEEYLRSLVWTTLESALAELPPAQRSVFELTELDDIPVKELAKASGTPVNTLLSRKHYAVLHLRKRLAALHKEMISG